MSDITSIIGGGFDASEAAAEAPKGGGNVPDGLYYFTISEERVETSEDSEYVDDGQVRICLTLEIQADLNNDTSLSGRKVFDDFWLAHEDQKKLAISKSYFGKLIEAVMGKGIILNDSKNLLNQPPFVAELKTKRAKNGKDYQNMVNVISVEESQANPPKASAPHRLRKQRQPPQLRKTLGTNGYVAK